ncbi:TspO/MBR family protein [Pseudidiomarina terrestris]|uniref:Tryptophan-rich sensory protein n=1 Tax=Pseudidiomarina terrestris TaxID=2820060 RepID=A0AAW7QZG7_9GAMM|nr:MULTISPECIES: TspO/MBR family protein [unclassified Pseudidiomarina]MDN7124127.1 tryptophan-rich sensory protein [Pseudidiomarina sp. 1APP75-32.1]MDN7127200.1 tryptophan-rich sensory protein [Pseudidiomarina sp. 1APR75-33.1]MDN7128384.1 tryptophan-rich sensory protein [Pseudidiomarina sp. 1APR75-15]MDN7135388.1 tryptophan-rich sensory protein [Pseudidiomarina sp. 1ASP75-5]MDN7138580.1 tryptophan-rich sensory protein [Pseudidiomarina sp. 1ASP75-14]
MSLMKQIGGLLGWLALSFIVAAIGGWGSANAPVFYRELTLPDWAPAAWLFGPVWTALYTMMAIAAWLVWREYGFTGLAKRALQVNLVQLALNMLWSWLFFAWYLGAVSFVEIILLWCAILATIVLYWRLNKAAAILMLPYLAWVSFAMALNYSIWQLNPYVL